MIIGCLFAILAAASPRIAFILLWIFTPVVNTVFMGNWLWPLLGVIFVPFTILLYVLVNPTNIWQWLIVLMGLLLDVRQYADAYENRNRVPMGSAAT
jgi:hypothetical protein